MDDTRLQEKSVPAKIRSLILLRVLLVTLLLGMAALIEISFGLGTEQDLFLFSGRRLFSLLVIIITSYVLSAAYLLLLRYNSTIQVNVYFQSLFDVLTVTALVYATGGIESAYSLFYLLVIIYSVMFLGRQGGMIISSASAIAYGLLFVAEYYLAILPMSYSLVSDYKYTAPYLFIRIFVHLLSFYLIALIASLVVEREKRVSSLLVERESAFEQLDLLHKSIIESVEAGIIIISLNGQIKLFNRAAEEITGYGNREVMNLRIERLLPQYEEIRGTGVPPVNHGRDGLAANRQIRGEVPFRRKDQNAITLGIAISPLRNSQGVKIGEILIFQDLTWTKKMEESLEKNRRLAFIGEMAAGLAHEIRNPLAAISGSVQMLKKSQYLSKKDQRLMEIVLRGKDQLESFMKDFLLLARPAPGMDESVNVGELLEDVLESLRMVPEWPEKCDVKLHLSQNPEIRAKKMEIRQVLWNLILNAIQSMPEGGGLTIETRISDEGVAERFWEIKISDTGVGIEDREIGLVMEPFYTTKERGTGLGLAIVNRIVARYAGAIRIEKNPVQGTTFIVRLPYMQPGKETRE